MNNLVVRRAQHADLDGLLFLYDQLADGNTAAAPADRVRSMPVLDAALADPARHLMIAVADDEIVGTADLLLVPNLTHRGQPWAIVENVVVTRNLRRGGVGRALMRRLIDVARAAGCYKLQLHSGKHRAEAHEFYRSLGMDAIAEGFKIYFE